MKMNLLVAREAAWMLGLRTKCRKVKIKIDGSLNQIVVSRRNQCTNRMPAKHSPDKEPLSLQIPRPLMGRLKRAARLAKMPFPAFIIAHLTQKTEHVVLTSKDYEAIAEATRRAEQTGKRCATIFDGAS